MNNQRRTTISTLRYYAIGCVFAFSDGVLITMRSPEHPRARRYTPEQTDNTGPTIGHKNTRQVTPWGVLPGGRNLPRFFLWIGTDNHRRNPNGSASGWEIVEMRGIEPRFDSDVLSESSSHKSNNISLLSSKHHEVITMRSL